MEWLHSRYVIFSNSYTYVVYTHKKHLQTTVNHFITLHMPSDKICRHADISRIILIYKYLWLTTRLGSIEQMAASAKIVLLNVAS